MNAGSDYKKSIQYYNKKPKNWLFKNKRRNQQQRWNKGRRYSQGDIGPRQETNSKNLTHLVYPMQEKIQPFNSHYGSTRMEHFLK